MEKWVTGEVLKPKHLMGSDDLDNMFSLCVMTAACHTPCGHTHTLCYVSYDTGCPSPTNSHILNTAVPSVCGCLCVSKRTPNPPPLCKIRIGFLTNENMSQKYMPPLSVEAPQGNLCQHCIPIACSISSFLLGVEIIPISSNKRQLNEIQKKTLHPFTHCIVSNHFLCFRHDW